MRRMITRVYLGSNALSRAGRAERTSSVTGHVARRKWPLIIGRMSISEQITQDITTAMKARDEHRLSTLRMVKSALKNKEVEKRGPLDDKEAMQVLSTLIKQRKDSIDAFTKGGRQELADREAAEIVMIESYMPKAVGAEEIAAKVRETIADMAATGTTPTMKDMGTVMKHAMAKFAGARVDGKAVSDAVKQALTPK